MSHEEKDTCMSHEEEDTCMSHEEEDTCMSHEEEDTYLASTRHSYPPHLCAEKTECAGKSR